MLKKSKNFNNIIEGKEILNIKIIDNNIIKTIKLRIKNKFIKNNNNYNSIKNTNKNLKNTNKNKNNSNNISKQSNKK